MPKPIWALAALAARSLATGPVLAAQDKHSPAQDKPAHAGLGGADVHGLALDPREPQKLHTAARDRGKVSTGAPMAAGSGSASTTVPAAR